MQRAKMIVALQPTIQNQPPDKSWVSKLSSEFPTVVENNYGKGKVLYYANQPDALTHSNGHQDVRNLLLRGVRYLAGSSLPIKTKGQELDMRISKLEDFCAVHIQMNV